MTATETEQHNSDCDCGRCRRRYAQTCDGSGTDPRCGTTTVHAHCICYLPMEVGQDMCDLCKQEGLVYTDVDKMVWDGRTYPSWRNHRRRGADADAYLALARAIGNPTGYTRML